MYNMASHCSVCNVEVTDDGKALECGPYKPRTDRCMNHAPAILAVPALIYSTHRLDYCCRFHLCSLVGRYAVLEV